MVEALIKLVLAVKSLAVNIWRALTPVRSWLYVTAAAVVILAITILGRHALPPKQVVLLTAPRGGSAERLGAILAQRLARPGIWEPQKRRFELIDRETEGFKYNREQVEKDFAGSIIAIAHDGFASAENVRILLPLETSYLHIVINRKCCESALRDLQQPMEPSAIDSSAKSASHALPSTSTLGELVPLLRSPLATEKVFLGRYLSGTREMAEFVLEHYQVPVKQVDCKQNYDWAQMRRALLDGNIMLGFHVAPLGFPEIRDLAAHGGCQLLGIDDVPGMQALSPHLGVGRIFRHAYGLSQNEERTFCPADIQTITARQVVLCSRYMSESDAYWLASQISDAVRDEMPTVEWEPTIPKEPAVPRQFVFRLHPGALALKEQHSPWYLFISSSLWQPLTVIVLLFVAAAIKQLNDKLVAGEAQAERPAEPAMNGRQDLERDFESFLSELKQTTKGVNWRSQRRRLLDWERTLTQARIRGEIGERAYESLWTGLREAAVTIEQSLTAQAAATGRTRR